MKLLSCSAASLSQLAFTGAVMKNLGHSLTLSLENDVPIFCYDFKINKEREQIWIFNNKMSMYSYNSLLCIIWMNFLLSH